MKLYYAPVSTYSQKALIAFKEKKQSFTPHMVGLMDPKAKEDYKKIYPMGKLPLLVLENGHLIPESSIIIEYLDSYFETGTRLIPADKDKARQTRFHDRMYDLYLNDPIVTLLFDNMKPENERNKVAAEKARERLDVTYMFMDKLYSNNAWTLGDQFTMADCAAAGPLFYAVNTYPFEKYKNINAYFNRLMERSSVKEVIDDAKAALKKMSV
jgi:glutathione S-transferase